MLNGERLRDVERECGFSYAADLWDFVPVLERHPASRGCPSAPPSGRLADARDVRAAESLGVPAGYAPFFCEDQPSHTDYYCCRKAGHDSGSAVLVFADHAVVQDWASVASFVEWVRRQHAASDA